jgi:hypothetical protein
VDRLLFKLDKRSTSARGQLNRIGIALLAALLGLGGAFFTWASFKDPSEAKDAVKVLLLCAFLVWLLKMKPW